MKTSPLLCAALLAVPLLVRAELASGIDKRNFDPSVRIQDNLYQAVNGGWVARTSIPGDQSSWSAFQELRDLSEQRVRQIIETAANRKDDANARQIAALYASFMNEAEVEARGIAPIQRWLDQVDAIASTDDVVKTLGAFQQLRMYLAISVGVDQDARDSSRYLLHALGSGLGLPDRDYYLVYDPRFTKARNAYRLYLNQLFALAGSTASQAARQSRMVMALETRLAEAQWSRADNRDPVKTYNKLDRRALAKLTPHIDWDDLLQAAGAGEQAANEINITQPSYFATFDTLLSKEPLEAWKCYLRARVLNHFAPYLPHAFVEANFAFRGRALSGAREIRPRWKLGVALVERNLGELVGKLYVQAHFPDSAKARVQALVDHLLDAYGRSIDGLAWMSPATKAAARDKLAHYRVKIGYPDKWRDFSKLELDANDLIGNLGRAAQFIHLAEMRQLGKPVDRDEWLVAPQTVNAYYNPTLNEVVFPAGLLQAPLFNAEADDAVNYGGIGSVIGHEISHGFDDEGSQFDGRGNLRDWWLSDDRQAFGKLTGQLIEQYGQYHPLPNRPINGRLTLGENIADVAGLQIAFKAYQLSLGGQPAPVIDGFTGEQRFFIGFAQIWRSKAPEEYTLQQLTSDPHAPSPYRPVGAAVNSDAFMQAFDVKPGDGMYKPESARIRIW
ncbi:M13 family metallopeptidase [Chitinimonas sp.]|uniref:M13 family metallopeptidase n=1 Tax=Chitinimonas sp. TaxID=1934313 RepID=UPI0035B05586